jgi:integrase/recombinase XerD
MGIVYIFWSRESGTYKIGYSQAKDAKNRLGATQVGHPFPLEIVRQWTVNNPRRLEERLHARFEAQCVQGEWFRLSEEDLLAADKAVAEFDDIGVEKKRRKPSNRRVSLYWRDSKGYHFADPRRVLTDDTQFVLRYEEDGKRKWETLPKGLRHIEARRAVSEKELALANPVPVQPKPRPQPSPVSAKTLPAAPAQKTDLSSVIDRHIDSLYAEAELKPKTIRSKQQILRDFAAWAGGRSLEEMDRALLMAWRERLLAEGYADRTANNKLVHVVSFLHACGLRGILAKKDWRSMKAQQRRTTRRAYSKAEIAAMRKAATEDERDVIEFLVGTGMRKNQAVATRWADIDFLNRVARVPEGVGTTETKKPRAAKLGAELLARLQTRRLRCPGTTYVFETRNGTPDDHIDRMVANAAKRGGVNLAGKSVLHSLRKTFATRLLNDAGYDVYRVSKLLGHSDVKTTELYLEFDSDAETAGDDIEEALAAGT